MGWVVGTLVHLPLTSNQGFLSIVLQQESNDIIMIYIHVVSKNKEIMCIIYPNITEFVIYA